MGSIAVILVTGVSGFIGRSLVGELLSRGERVVGIDRSERVSLHTRTMSGLLETPDHLDISRLREELGYVPEQRRWAYRRWLDEYDA